MAQSRRRRRDSNPWYLAVRRFSKLAETDAPGHRHDAGGTISGVGNNGCDAPGGDIGAENDDRGKGLNAVTVDRGKLHEVFNALVRGDVESALARLRDLLGY